MKTWYSLIALAALLSPGTLKAQISVPALLDNGDVSIRYTGTSNQNYVAEWAESLTPPMGWTPLLTNAADSNGVLTFTNTPTGLQRFYRVRPHSPAPLAVPFVYTVENTGTNCAPPPLPTLANLPIILPLTDPFEWSDGSGRSTNFIDWSCRRAQIKAEFENYEIGPKPNRPENITAGYTNGTLTVAVTVGTNTLILNCTVALPAGEGPFPAVIGMNSGSGSLPFTIFSNRSIARITFSHNQVTTYNNPQNTNPYYRLYPNLNVDSTGQYSAWAWGVSRIIDGLELVQDTLPINLERLAVTGCSYAGKMALFAGAFDERIALTIAQESGGGGAAAWRVSETLGEVEKLGATSHQWFRESMFQFSGSNVPRLPMDHHELMAMCAPRALLVFGNPDYVWLADESGYVSCRAAHEVYKTFGVGNRFGFDIVGGHVHCTPANSQNAAAIAFVERFLLGNTNASTVITNAPTYAAVNYRRWFEWWGTGIPAFPTNAGSYTRTFETECATVGTNWIKMTDPLASNGGYVTAQPGLDASAAAPAGNWNWVTIPFSPSFGGNYTISARLDCPTTEDDSLWIKIDAGAWLQRTGLTTSGWDWVTLNTYNLTPGLHVLNIAYSEDGAKLDKISISDTPFAPTGLGEVALKLCTP